MDRIVQLAKIYGLSKRQVDVLRELDRAPYATSDELAPRLGCSTSTVNVHLFKIFEKLKIKNKRELLQFLQDFEPKNSTKTGRKLQLVLIDRDPQFSSRIIGLLNEMATVSVDVRAFADCNAGLAYLEQTKQSLPGTCFPHLIFLDLEFPLEEGLACLEKIKADPAFLTVPLLLFAQEANQSILEGVYKKGSNTCVVKPSEDEELKQILRLALDYWAKVGVLPDQYWPS